MIALTAVLARTTRILNDHFTLLAGYVGWLLVPTILGMALYATPATPLRSIALLFLVVFSLVLLVLLVIILSRLVYGLIYGVRLSHEVVQTDSKKLFLPVATTLFLEGITIGGLAPLIIPALLLCVWIGFAHLAVILDGKRPIEALFYSYTLSRGRFFSLSWLLLGGALVWIGLYAGVLLGVLILAAVITGNWGLLETSQFPLWFTLLDTLARLFLLGPILFIHSLCIYEAARTPATESTRSVSPPINSP